MNVDTDISVRMKDCMEIIVSREGSVVVRKDVVRMIGQNKFTMYITLSLPCIKPSLASLAPLLPPSQNASSLKVTLLLLILAP